MDSTLRSVSIQKVGIDISSVWWVGHTVARIRSKPVPTCAYAFPNPASLFPAVGKTTDHGRDVEDDKVHG